MFSSAVSSSEAEYLPFVVDVHYVKALQLRISSEYIIEMSTSMLFGPNERTRLFLYSFPEKPFTDRPGFFSF